MRRNVKNMAAPSTPTIILGCGTVGDKSDPWAKYPTRDAAQAFLDVFRKAGYVELDTARAYSPHAPGSSEPLLGQTDFKDWALMDTKIPYSPGSGTAGKVAESVRLSLEALGVSKVHIMFIHGPDRTTPFAETYEAIDDEYRAGKFDEFGLSNFSAAEVEECVRMCTDKGWVVPTVYQGHYNAITRGGEKDLFPVLRKYGIKFYAFTPGAAGFFSGKITKDSETPGSRWDSSVAVGKLYRDWFFKEDLFSAANQVHTAAQKDGISGHAVALRWILHHSALDAKLGDGIIIGASSLPQLEENLQICKAGPLPSHLVQMVDEIGGKIRDQAPPHSF